MENLCEVYILALEEKITNLNVWLQDKDAKLQKKNGTKSIFF